MRLLHAELIKLARPLTWGVAAAAALFCVLLAVGGAHNAALEGGAPAVHIPSCAELGIPAGPRCARAEALQRARVNQASAEPAQVAAQLNPLAAGAEAAGLMASLPGALALALLAGAHIGGEWSGRTMKNLLAQQGRRWRVLAAKLVSLWLAGIGLIAVCWVALAATGPVLVRVDHLPAPREPAAHALSLAGSQAARPAGARGVRRHRPARRRGDPGHDRDHRRHGGSGHRDADCHFAADPRPVDPGHLGAGVDGFPGRPGVGHVAADQLLVPLHQRRRRSRPRSGPGGRGRSARRVPGGGGCAVPRPGHRRMTLR
jgi:hypothetical protein